MKVKVVCRKLYDYIRYDLKEIAFPSSLPDPPHIKKRCKLTWPERFSVLKEASRLYAASWVRDIGPDLRPNDYKKDDETEGKPNGDKSRTKMSEPSTLEDIAVAARGGMETLRPALQRLYMTRASAYRDALKSFIEGYQEDHGHPGPRQTFVLKMLRELKMRLTWLQKQKTNGTREPSSLVAWSSRPIECNPCGCQTW
ncbi:hypothetical protein V6N13_072912 [Hibiscus sabdariffa]|uniref:Uncharacterized protein n=1 Tax=Hibiscus sabdariffa TaxID=183260 RepID=A0ABR2E7J9_9ROSI